MRKVIECAEVKGLDSQGEIDVELLFEWDAATDKWPLLSESYYLKKSSKNESIQLKRLSKISK